MCFVFFFSCSFLGYSNRLAWKQTQIIMEKCVGYDNSACCVSNDSCRPPAVSTMEMEQVVCCGRPKSQNSGAPTQPDDKFSPAGASGDNKIVITPNACQPKCPAIRTAPWDPIKTRFVAFLTLAMVVWLLVGVFTIHY